MDSYYFDYSGQSKKGNDLITIPGVSYGVPVERIYSHGDYDIWKIKGHNFSYGISATAYFQTEYILLRISRDDRVFNKDRWLSRADDEPGAYCKIKGFLGSVIRREHPGREWRPTLDNMKAQAILSSLPSKASR